MIQKQKRTWYGIMARVETVYFAVCAKCHAEGPTASDNKGARDAAVAKSWWVVAGIYTCPKCQGKA